MKRIITFGTLTLFLLVLSSCRDEWVDRDPVFTISSENFFNSQADYENALIGAYDILQSLYVNFFYSEVASDNALCGGESATDVIGLQQIDDMTHGPINDQLNQVWDWNFAGVQRTNYILEFQDNIDFPGKARIIAETRFLRAYYNFELVKWFGAIPIKPEGRFVLGDELTIPRSPTSEVYAFIEEDLQAAIRDMTYDAPIIGRATRGSAEALLGKVLLYQEKFSEAAQVLEGVIANGPYDLVENYDEIFERSSENNVESVFEVQYTDSEGAGFGCLQCSEGNVAVGFMGVRNYSGPLFDPGFSFSVPTQEAYDAYTPNDIRRDIAILNIDDWAAQTGATFTTGFEHTGFFNRKYIPRQGDLNIGDQNLTNPTNYRAIRFADVLLMAAEALARGGGNEDQARTYLNRVRERAGLDPTTLTGNALVDAIWNERRLELMGEGHRFFDLVRTGQAANAIPGFVAGKNELFPLPQKEIDFAQGNWEQNPNY